jgi:low temperature requirement protein LtrA
MNPLALNALLSLCIADVFGGPLAGFSKLQKNITGVLAGVYVVIVIEFLGPLTVSMIWWQLSFKAAHVGERLGLLDLIIIGRGLIRLTKTIVRAMGKNGHTIGDAAQEFYVILILVRSTSLGVDELH